MSIDPELEAVNKEIFKGTKTPVEQLSTEGYFACFICDRVLESNQKYGQFKSGSTCGFCTILMKQGVYFLGLKKPYTPEQQRDYDTWKLDMSDRKGCIWKPRRTTPNPLLAIVNSKNITATTDDGKPISIGALLTAPDSPLNTPEFIDMFTKIMSGTFTGMVPTGTNMNVNGTQVNNISNNRQMQQFQTFAQNQQTPKVPNIPKVQNIPKITTKKITPKVKEVKIDNKSNKIAPKKNPIRYSKLPITIPLKVTPKPSTVRVTKPKTVYISEPKKA